MNLETLLALETQVWEALRSGDASADAALLAEDFVGLYPTGFADRNAHAGQLTDGPTVLAYTIGNVRFIGLGPDHALLGYRADYHRPGSTHAESMYVSSTWAKRDDRWINVFSQDTPVDPEADLP